MLSFINAVSESWWVLWCTRHKLVFIWEETKPMGPVDLLWYSFSSFGMFRGRISWILLCEFHANGKLSWEMEASYIVLILRKDDAWPSRFWLTSLIGILCKILAKVLAIFLVESHSLSRLHLPVVRFWIVHLMNWFQVQKQPTFGLYVDFKKN